MAVRETPVPYSGAPQVEPQNSAIPQQTDNLPIAAFGGATAEATSKLGGDVSRAGNELFERAYAMQQLKQNNDASNAVYEANKQIADKFADYGTLQGQAAVDGYKPFISSIDGIREDVGNNLTSPYARNLYQTQLKSIQSSYIRSASFHSAQQLKSYHQATINSGIAAGNTAMIAQPNDEEIFAKTLANNQAFANEYFQSNGIDPTSDIAKQYLLKQNSTSVLERVKATAHDDPFKAGAFLKTAMDKGLISGEEQFGAQNYVHSQQMRFAHDVLPQQYRAGGSVGNILTALRTVESSGNYGLDKTFHADGKPDVRVIGAYSIRADNVAPWLKEAGMPEMSIEDFRGNRNAQDQLAAFKAQQYLKEGGSPQAVANAWRGKGSDPYVGENADAYIGKFNQALGKATGNAQSTSDPDEFAKARGITDPEVLQTFKMGIKTQHSAEMQMNAQQNREYQDTILEGIGPDKNGKLPTSINDLPQPAQDALTQLQKTSPGTYLKVTNQLQRNMQKGYEFTPQTYMDYQKYKGIMADGASDNESKQEVLNADLLNEPWPWKERVELAKMRTSMMKGTLQNVAVGHALQLIAPSLPRNYIENPKGSHYQAFKGALSDALSAAAEANGGKKINDAQIKDIATVMLQNHVDPNAGYFSSQKREFETQVPEAEKKAIIDAYSRHYNRTPADHDIRGIYMLKLYQLSMNKRAADAEKINAVRP